MNQKLIIGIVAIIIVATAGVGIYSSNNSKTEMMQKEAMAQKENSAMEQEKVVMEAFELGADDYITKPFSLNEMAIRVKRLMNQYGRIPNK